MLYLRVGCKHAFTRYPQGVDRSAARLLSALERPASMMSGWRAVQEADKAAIAP